MSVSSLNAAISYDDARYDQSPVLGFGKTLNGETCSVAATAAQKLKLIGLVVLGALTLAAVGALLATGIGAVIAASISASLIIGMQAGALAGAGLGLTAALVITLRLGKGANRVMPASNNFESGHLSAPRVGEVNTNTSIMVSKDGQETAQLRHALFAQAKQSIEWSCNFAGGGIFCQSLNIIKTSMLANENLQVRILCSENLLEGPDLALLDQMRRDFPDRFQCLVTNQKIVTVPEFSTIENHVKALIVDGKYFVIGGTGHHDVLSDKGDQPKSPKPGASIQTKGIGGGARDMDFVGSGDSAGTMREEFYKLWAIWKYQMSSEQTGSLSNEHFELSPQSAIASLPSLDRQLIPNSRVKVLVCGGAQQPVNACSKELVRMIDSAKKTIKLAQLSFNPHPEVFDALLRAVNRDVEVELITNELNSASGAGLSFVTPSNRQQYLPLMTGGRISKLGSKKTLATLAAKKAVKIFEYNLAGIMLHTKLTIVDGATSSGICLTGSSNMVKNKPDFEMNMIVRTSAIERQEKQDHELALGEGESKIAQEGLLEESVSSVAKNCQDVFESIKAKSKPVDFDQAYHYRANLFHRLYGKLMQWYVIANVSS